MNLALDLDGTLITAEEKQSILLKAVASRYKVSIECEYIWDQKRSGKSNYQLLNDLGIDHLLTSMICADWLREIETPYWQSLDVLFDDTHSSLVRIKNNNIKLSLITARKNERLMRLQIHNLGISNFFDAIHCVSPSDAVASKSSILSTSNFVGFVGDSETDLEASKLANVPFYAVSTGQRSDDFLSKKGAPSVFNSLSLAVNKFLNDCNA